MSVWHMLDIFLIWVKTKLKKPWQPIIFCGNKEKKLALVFYASIEGAITDAEFAVYFLATPN